MMVLHQSTTDEAPGRNALQKSTIRRRRSKGTIAGFAFKTDVAATPEMSGGEDATASPAPSTGTNASSNSPQHSPEKNKPPKPCNSSRLALLCIQNTLSMGARTQLFLTPPGRPRRELQAQLADRDQGRALYQAVAGTNDSSNGYYTVDRLLGKKAAAEYKAKAEELFRNASAYTVDSDEEGSSGDDDDLEALDALFSDERGRLDEDKYAGINEPLFTPVLSNPNDASMASMGRGSGKLPFNRRKIRLFDLITADDREKARAYLRQEMQKSRQRQGYLLARHLRRMQREELRKKRQEAGEPTDDLADSDNEAPPDIYGGVGAVEGEMTPALSAALLLESLAMNPIESLEGMAKCYEGIVDAGVALVEAQTVDPTKPAGMNEKVKATRSEVMAALAPLLITSLEQPSGEVILMLAKLRRMCGTTRYQRRFVQRVAPALIRPPRGAMWCLRHQNDMEAILAAAELIFDSAFDVFSKGWYERGRLILADSKRAKTLHSAAEQLRNLSSEPTEGLGRGNRRRRGLAMKNPDKSGATTEPLAEWEVIAVDRQIRISISNVISNDWSKSLAQVDTHKTVHRRPVSSKRYGALMHSPSVEMSPKSIASPRSPARVASYGKGPVSPPHVPSQQPPPSSADTLENVFGPAFSSQSVTVPDQRSSPPPQPSLSPSPPTPNHKTYDRPNNEHDQKSPQSPKKEAELSDPHRAPLSPKLNASPKSRSNNSQLVSSEPRPLSPASSAFQDKPSQSVVSAALTTVTTQTAQYRTLTSTAAERKRTVAACRALRAQIQRFEDAFIQLHGRPPKGTAERAPLATTYAQYREWKRAIRADAACRIQALFRGASTRWALLRSNNANASRVVLRRAGRPNDKSPDLNLPVEISDSDQDPSAHSGAESDSSGPGPARTRHSSPKWTARPLRPRMNIEERPAVPSPEPTMTPSSRSPSPPSTPTQQGSLTSDLATLSLPELQARKRDLKQQLKQYDMNFARRNGRMPVKAEKEPIRHLYEAYNALKNQISDMEKEGRHSITSVVSPPPVSAAPLSSSLPPTAEKHRLSIEEPKVPPRKSKTAIPLSPPPQDLAALKAEKSHLHQMLRSYEKDFFREHNRQVSSFADIKPVAAQYRRYKEIKKAIASLTGSGK